MKYLIKSMVFAILLAVTAMTTQANEILNFKPTPVSQSLDEFVWDGAQLSAGPGAISSGDGNLLGGAGEVAPGLLFSTPFSIPGLSSGKVGSDGSTDFFDGTLSISGFNATGPAVGSSVLFQPLGSGAFELFSSSDTSGGRVLLLGGSFEEAFITGINNTDTGGVLSASITYTSGLIFDQLDNGLPVIGSLSWSLIDINPNILIDPGTGMLRPFAADGTGSFSAEVIPAPMALPAGIALLAGMIAFRSKRRRHLLEV